jgi:hypothetical protein
LGQRSRKRKRGAAGAAKPAPGSPAPDDFAARYRARGQARDEAARAALVPLEEGERPLAVTIGAILALVSAVVNFALAAAGVEIRGEEQSLLGQGLLSVLLLAMAAGMWGVRYWAVLGMQALLALTLIVLALTLFLQADVLSGLLIAAIMGALGSLFWFLVKAMARIQMPVRE